MENSPSFWDTTWSRKTERYNRHHAEIWEAILPYIEGEILDLGCGQATPYIGKNFSVTGIDWSEKGIEVARLNVPNGTFIQGDLRNPLPFEDGIFDTVLLLGVLDYFQDWTHILNEAKRVKKPNGRIVATLLHGFQGHNWKQYPHITGNWHLATF